MVYISYIIVNIHMIYRAYQWQMTVLKGTPHHLGQSQFPLNHLARRKNILKTCEDCSGNRAGGIAIPTPIYLAIATLTNKLLLCTCSSEIKGKDCAKYDEMYHTKSVLWISEITSSPKPQNIFICHLHWSLFTPVLPGLATPSLQWRTLAKTAFCFGKRYSW